MVVIDVSLSDYYIIQGKNGSKKKYNWIGD